MSILLIGMVLFILSGLPALLIITACISAARTSRNEETLCLSSRVSPSA
jgi:hypothetical protein